MSGKPDLDMLRLEQQRTGNAMKNKIDLRDLVKRQLQNIGVLCSAVVFLLSTFNGGYSWAGGISSGTQPQRAMNTILSCVDSTGSEQGFVNLFYTGQLEGSFVGRGGARNSIVLSKTEGRFQGTPSEEPLRYDGDGFEIQVMMTNLPVKSSEPMVRPGMLRYVVNNREFKSSVSCTLNPKEHSFTDADQAKRAVAVSDVGIMTARGCGQPPPSGQSCGPRTTIHFTLASGGLCHEYHALAKKQASGEATILITDRLSQQGCTRPEQLNYTTEVYLEGPADLTSYRLLNPIYARVVWAP